MNRPEQPIAKPEPGRPSQPIAEPAHPALRLKALTKDEQEKKDHIESLIPGGAGIPYNDLVEQARMDAEELQVILDELAAEGKISQAVNNNVLCYVHL